MAKIIIQSTTTKTETKQIEVSLPYFCKYDNSIYKVVSPVKVIKIAKGDYHSTLTVAHIDLYNKEIGNASVCAEYEFEMAMTRVIFDASEQSITGTATSFDHFTGFPKERDENVEVETMIQDRLDKEGGWAL